MVGEPKSQMRMPCSTRWTIFVDEKTVKIGQARKIDPATGASAILIAEPRERGSKIIGIPSPKVHVYQVVTADDAERGTDRWIMPLGPGIKCGALQINQRTVVELQCGPDNNIVTYKFTDRDNTEAFLVTSALKIEKNARLGDIDPIADFVLDNPG
jgi:hypothetical protein